MKIFVAIALMGCISTGIILEDYLSIGQACQSDGDFTISSFTVNPYPPPIGCSPQAVQVKGTFKNSVCPNQVQVHETYNQRQSYNQQIGISGCYTQGQVVTYNLTITPVQCSPGFYQIQIGLSQQNPQRRVACWEYQYTT